MASVLSKIWNFLKGLPEVAWEIISFVIVVFVAVLYRNKNKQAESELEGAEAKKTDAVLEAHQSDIHVREQEIITENDKQKQNVPATPDDLAKELNKI